MFARLCQSFASMKAKLSRCRTIRSTRRHLAYSRTVVLRMPSAVIRLRKSDDAHECSPDRKDLHWTTEFSVESCGCAIAT